MREGIRHCQGNPTDHSYPVQRNQGIQSTCQEYVVEAGKKNLTWNYDCLPEIFSNRKLEKIKSQTWNHAAARPRFEMRRTGQSWRLVGRKYFPKIVVRKRVARKYCP